MKIIKINGCHDCDPYAKDFTGVYDKDFKECIGIWECIHLICMGMHIEKQVESKTIHPDCPLDDNVENKVVKR